MDRGLISLKLTVLRHSPAGLRPAGWVVGAVLVAATWGAAVAAGSDTARHSVLTLALVLWGVGTVLGPVLMSGAGTLRPAWFALLPLPRAALGRGLLVSVFVSVAAGVVLLAMLAPAVHALLLDPSTLLVAVPGALLTWVLLVALSRLVYGLLGAAMGSRVGVEIASIQFGLMFAGMFAGWIPVWVAVERTPDLLATGVGDAGVTRGLDLSPTSWTVLAVERAARGDWGGALLWLGGLALLTAVVVAATVPLLVPSAEPGRQRRGGRRRSARLVAGGGWLPATPTGAVVAKELRQWRRDRWRTVETQSGLWTGLFIGAFALAHPDVSVAAPFAGLVVAFMLGISGCTVYGQDGSAVWLDIVGQGPGTVRADVRGRQWAMALTYLPGTLVVSVAFVLLTRDWWVVAPLLAAIPALLGASAGVALLIAAVGVSPGVDPRLRVGPNDAVGPDIGLQIWVSMTVVSLCVLPTAGMIVLHLVAPAPWTAPAMVAVGLVTGFGVPWLFGRVTSAYLERRLPDLFSRIRYKQVFREGPARGVLDRFETTTLKSDQEAAERRRKEREAQVAGGRRP